MRAQPYLQFCCRRGPQDGRDCTAGNDGGWGLRSYEGTDACAVPCTGSASAGCGDTNRISVYQLVDR